MIIIATPRRPCPKLSGSDNGAADCPEIIYMMSCPPTITPFAYLDCVAAAEVTNENFSSQTLLPVKLHVSQSATSADLRLPGGLSSSATPGAATEHGPQLCWPPCCERLCLGLSSPTPSLIIMPPCSVTLGTLSEQNVTAWRTNLSTSFEVPIGVYSLDSLAPFFEFASS